MRQTLKEKWIKALESGEYKQGQGVLVRGYQDNKTFCCLGVLCDITDSRLRQNTYMPGTATLKKCGLSFKTANLLASKNDRGESFKKIARWLKENKV